MITVLESFSKLPDNMAFQTFVADNDADVVEAFKEAHPDTDGYLIGQHVYYAGRIAKGRYRIQFVKREEKA